MKKILYCMFVCTILLTSCKKDSNNEKNEDTGIFTPPTENYWRIDDGKPAQMGAVSLNGDGFYAMASGFDNPFNNGICQLSVALFGTKDNGIPSSPLEGIPEGGYKEYPITVNPSTRAGVTTSTPDSVYVGINGYTPYNTVYHATSGKLYVSKHSGKLRFTSKGELPVKGRKTTESTYSFNSKIDFSIEMN
ncbi:hypothetical protein [Pseudopedobacter beijingensis]|uniref:Lipocalin-like domain-containing protein n=1 Tax=Pseudopedobacter beijingensis TaxID=1207056 RepID=A0ABW4I9C4_9SPHI